MKLKKSITCFITVLLLATASITGFVVYGDEEKIPTAKEITENQKEQTSDESDLFVTLDDLSLYKGVMEAKGLELAGKRVGNCHVVFIPKGNKVTVLSSGKHGINDNTYKSLLSAIETLFENHKATDYFYSHFSKTEDVSFEGFEVKINPKKNKTEKKQLKEEDFIRVTIDFEKAKKAVENEKYDTTNSIEELYDKISEVPKKTTDKMQSQYGKSESIFVIIGKVIAAPICILALIVFIFKLRTSSLFTSRRKSAMQNSSDKRDSAGEDRFRRIMGVSDSEEETIEIQD